MGVSASKTWPLDSDQPFGVKSDHTWSEIGAIMRIIDECHVQTFIETGAGRGDLSAWMIAKCRFVPGFQYLGITNDPSGVDMSIQSQIGTQERAFIAIGAPCSDGMMRKVGSLIRNSSCAMVLCNGLDIEREVDRYLQILRPGDVIAAHQFLVQYRGRKLMDMARNERLDRIVGDWITRTRFIAGVLL